MHLAQLNITRWKIDTDSDEAAGFFNAIERVNAVADRADGFVWRFIDPLEGDVKLLKEWERDGFIVNASVWETPKAFEHFVWNTIHKRIYERKDEWFEAPAEQRFVMWWVEPGTTPSLAEAKARLDHLNEHGDSDHAFGWAHLPSVKLWQTQRCA